MDAQPTDPPASMDIPEAARALGGAPLTEDALRVHVWPLFSRVREALGDRIYLANHSLGRPPDRTAEDVRRAVDLWYTELGGAWDGWSEIRSRYRAGIAELIGCARHDAVVPKTSVAQGLRAVLNALPEPTPNVVTTRGEFDSVDHVLKASAHKGRARVRFVDADGAGALDGREIAAAITDETDLVVVSVVAFVTGQIVPRLGEVIERARERGVLVLLDTYHAAGVMPLRFDDLGADFMVGGNYKYTRGGPGACWLAIHPRHLTEGGTPDPGGLFTLDTGWFAKREPFAYQRSETVDLAPGGDGWLEATPAVLAEAQALAGLELTNALGVERLRAHNLDQQRRLTDLLGDAGVRTVRVARPDQPEPSHGAFVLVPVENAEAALAALDERGVTADARPCPTTGSWSVRLCPDLLTSDDELVRASRALAEALGRIG